MARCGAAIVRMSFTTSGTQSAKRGRKPMRALIVVILQENLAAPTAGAMRLSPAWLETDGGCTIGIAFRCALGRAPENDVVIPSERISRWHARIEVRENGVHWLKDLGSRNGTWLNGSRIACTVPLRDGDRVGFSHIAFTFRQRPA